VIRLRDVQLAYPGTAQPAVNGVNLEVERGTTVALIGPSGCGKSTLLRLILGLVRQDAGNVTFDNHDANDTTARRRLCGYVIQDGGLFPHLTARQNVTLLPETLDWPKTDRDDRVADLCRLTHFPTDGLDRFPSELSGGQQQRVALMRALVTDPPVLLMDEPLGALDPMIRYDLQQELRQIFRELKKTVVVVTHDLVEATYFGDRVVLMRNGRIVQEGTPQDLSERPAEAFVTQFVTAQRGIHGEAA
jgi:osmoprotectant transport system ATP-binding protein